MCECYTIGGPWIAEDPDCPAHGREAQELRQTQEEEQEIVRQEMEALRAEVAELRRLFVEYNEIEPDNKA